jgi:hypothetical protein
MLMHRVAFMLIERGGRHLQSSAVRRTRSEEVERFHQTVKKFLERQDDSCSASSTGSSATTTRSGPTGASIGALRWRPSRPAPGPGRAVAGIKVLVRGLMTVSRPVGGELARTKS